MKTSRTIYFWMALLSSLAVIACQPRSRAEVDQIIANSEHLSKIDSICQSLGKPDDFVELKKGLGGNSNHSTIEYQYKMSRSFDSAVEHFKNECAKSQCSLASEYNNRDDKSYRTLNFRIDGVKIEVEYRADFGSIVNYGCSM